MRAEEILDAVVTKLTGLTTTGSNVQRGQVYDSHSTEMPGLAIFMGVDTLEEELSTSVYNWLLSIIIESRVESSTSQIDEILNTIRGEVHSAIMTDYTLGLAFVIDINPITAAEPILSAAGDKPIGTQRLEYEVKYRTSRANLST